MGLNDDFGLRLEELTILRRIFQRFPAIAEVRIFGSRATGHSRRTSDLDLAIFAPGASSAEWSQITEALEEAPIIYELDAVRGDQLKPGPLSQKIQAQAIVLYLRSTPPVGPP